MSLDVARENMQTTQTSNPQPSCCKTLTTAPLWHQMISFFKTCSFPSFKKAKKTPNKTKPYHMQWNFACFIMLVQAVSLVKMQPLCLNDSESFETDWSLLNCMDLPNSLLSEVSLTDGSCDLSRRTTKAKKPRSSNTLWLVGSWIMVMLEPVKPQA